MCLCVLYVCVLLVVGCESDGLCVMVVCEMVEVESVMDVCGEEVYNRDMSCCCMLWLMLE